MAAGAWNLYNDFKANVFKKLMNLSATDTFKVALVASTSNGINVALVGATYSALTNELTTANGYTATGASAGSPSLTGGGGTGTITFDTADVSWTASGGNIVARAAIIYDVTSGHLIAYCLLDSTPADYTLLNGDTLTIQIANVFTAT